ncbi:uncharacterized protein CBL_20057 [Carabus blaptoides fortunei]
MNHEQRLLFIGMLLEEDDNRNLRDTTNPFEVPENNFKKMFRLNKITTLDLIHALEPFLIQSRRDTIPIHLKVLGTLNFLGTGSFQNSVGCNNWISISQASMSRIINEICTIISDQLLQQWVKFCITREEKTSVKRRFYEKWGARGVVGCVDGTHVEILAPPITDEIHPPFVYINRKGKHSINVMLISDSDSKIIACNARYPGSVHDSAIWQMSNVRRHMIEEYETGDKYTHLIGDSGYPLEPWLFTPINNAPDGSAHSRFNEELCSVRNVAKTALLVHEVWNKYSKDKCIQLEAQNYLRM